MTVRIAKQPINLRERLSELERPIGLNGQALLATSTPQEAFDLLGAGRRNLIINGDMRIAQRASSVTGSNGGGYTVCDRWNLFDSSGSVNIAQSSTVPTTTGFANSLQFTVNSTGTLTSTSVFTPNQQIEGFNSVQLLWGTSNAKPITVSFWCRSSVAGTYGIFVRNSAADRYYTTTFNIASIDTWQYVTATIPGDTSGTWIGATNDIGLTVGITLRAGSSRVGTSGVWSSSATYSSSSQVDWHGVSSATFYITGVQLEEGKVATPFEYRSIGEELALCQRYYEKSFEDTTTPSLGTNSTSFSTEVGLSWGWSGHRSGYPANAYHGRSTFVKFRVPKRATPSVGLYGNSAGYPYIYDTTNGARWVNTSWGVYNSKEGFEMVNEFTSQFQVFAFCHWTASAEL
jgi:hypothetical protein